MSDPRIRYRLLSTALFKAKTEAQEETILDEMDGVWDELDEEGRAWANQGSIRANKLARAGKKEQRRRKFRHRFGIPHPYPRKKRLPPQEVINRLG